MSGRRPCCGASGSASSRGGRGREVIPWTDLHLTSVRGHEVQLDTPTARVHTLAEEELAELGVAPAPCESHGSTLADPAHAAARAREPRPAFRKAGRVTSSGASFDSVVMLRRSSLLVLFAVVGPGLFAGCRTTTHPASPPIRFSGPTTDTSSCGSSTSRRSALILFHELGARMGVVTGQGLTGLMRERYGVRLAALGVLALLVANIGTTCAEFAGVAASLDLAGVSRYPLGPRGCGRHLRTCPARVVPSGRARLSAHVDAPRDLHRRGVCDGAGLGAAVHGLIVPTVPATKAGLLAITATVGTTLAPWGLAFIQSYAADKKLTVADLRYERIDVATGAVMTGVIGFFVVVTCADTLHKQGTSITDAGDAASALEPLAGRFATVLFGAGLLGASILAASILPLATAYSVSEVFGQEAALDDPIHEAPVFYGTFAAVIASAAAIVLIPGAPLVPILYLSQALNAILLLPILVFVVGITRDRTLMGEHASGRVGTVLAVLAIGLLALCVGALAVLSVV